MNTIRHKSIMLKNILSMTRKLLGEFGFRLAVYYFLKSTVFRKENVIGKKMHVLQYSRIKEIIRVKYSDIIEKHKKNNKYTCGTIGDYKNIWLIWWQGIDENTPGKIYINIKQLKKLNPNWKITVISKYNYQDYISPISNLISYAEEKKISLTHVSDYIRVLLLRKYGGVYIDVNFFVTESFEKFVDYPFYTIKHGLYSEFHVCRGLWLTGFMATGKDNPLYAYLEEMYNQYFVDYDFIPSYLFIDALISVGYENIPIIKDEINQIPYNNSHYNYINQNGNNEYDVVNWERLSKDTCYFNVNYKKSFISRTTDGKETYYGHLYSTKNGRE